MGYVIFRIRPYPPCVFFLFRIKQIRADTVLCTFCARLIFVNFLSLQGGYRRIRADTETRPNTLIYKYFINHIRLSALSAHFFTRTRESDFLLLWLVKKHNKALLHSVNLYRFGRPVLITCMNQHPSLFQCLASKIPVNATQDFFIKY